MPAIDDLDPPTLTDFTAAPARPRCDREELVAALAEIQTEAAMSASVRPDDELREVVVRVAKVAAAAIRRARGM